MYVFKYFYMIKVTHIIIILIYFKHERHVFANETLSIWVADIPTWKSDF